MQIPRGTHGENITGCYRPVTPMIWIITLCRMAGAKIHFKTLKRAWNVSHNTCFYGAWKSIHRAHEIIK
jgi:hypothetical protein